MEFILSHSPLWCGRLLCVLCACVVGCDSPTQQPEAKPVADVTVNGDLYEVVEVRLPTIARVQGTLFPDEVTVVSARVPGRVIKMNCDLGDTVQLGDQILQIEDSEYILRVAQAEAQLSQARAAVGLNSTDPVDSLDPMNSPPVRETRAILDEAKQSVERLKRLYQQGAVVATDYEAAELAQRVADAKFSSALNSVRERIALIGVQSAQLDLARQQLSDTQVFAPMDGQIQRRMVAVGTFIQAGQSVVEIARTNTLRYRASVPERYAQRVAVGQTVKLSINDQEIQVQVSRISPTIDPMSRSLVFEAEVPNSENVLRSGLFSQAELVLDDSSKGVVIPKSALVRFAGVDKTWKVTDGKVAEAVVEIGAEFEDTIEITNGLQPGDVIFLNGSAGRVGTYVAEQSSDNRAADEVSSEASTTASRGN